jgi:hypothetical protein
MRVSFQCGLLNNLRKAYEKYQNNFWKSPAWRSLINQIISRQISSSEVVPLILFLKIKIIWPGFDVSHGPEIFLKLLPAFLAFPQKTHIFLEGVRIVGDPGRDLFGTDQGPGRGLSVVRDALRSRRRSRSSRDHAGCAGFRSMASQARFIPLTRFKFYLIFFFDKVL